MSYPTFCIKILLLVQCVVRTRSETTDSFDGNCLFTIIGLAVALGAAVGITLLHVMLQVRKGQRQQHHKQQQQQHHHHHQQQQHHQQNQQEEIEFDYDVSQAQERTCLYEHMEAGNNAIYSECE